MRLLLLGAVTLVCALGCGGDDDGGTGDGDGDITGAEFCAEYGDVCGYGQPPERFQEEEDCVSEYGGRPVTRQECMVEHLGLAADDPELHCPHATGGGPCS